MHGHPMQNGMKQVSNTAIRTNPVGRKTSTGSYFRLTFKDLLSVLTAITVPIAIGIYTGVTNNQQATVAKLTADRQQHIADESQQQQLYNDFIDDMYQLDKDGELNESRNPWAFANARYRAVHRQLDGIRKAYVLQFLKEKELIGRNQCQTGCEQKALEDIIRLSRLNFDHLQLFSETGKLDQMNLKCAAFDRVSLIGAMITNVDLSGTTFQGSNLSGTKFTGSSLACAMFNGTQMDGIDFGDANLAGATFINVDLSKVKMTPEQRQQSTFINQTTPTGTVFAESTTRFTQGKVDSYLIIILKCL